MSRRLTLWVCIGNMYRFLSSIRMRCHRYPRCGSGVNSLLKIFNLLVDVYDGNRDAREIALHRTRRIFSWLDRITGSCFEFERTNDRGFVV